MGRYAKHRDVQHPKPVERIELSEKNVGLRLLMVAVLILVAVISFGYGISQLLHVESGWTEIEADGAADTNSSNEFVLMYQLGSREDMSITAENKGIIALYTNVMEKAYQVFHDNQEIKGVNNIYYINQHPNEKIEVDAMLYQAFELIQQSKNRMIYLAPIYELYNNLFDCEDDSQAKEFDPFVNEELALTFKEIAAFAQDEDAIRIELLGNNQIQLCVSDAYLKYVEENELTSYVDFAWMKNAFVVDYLANELIAAGYTAATISSYDGFSRNLDESGTGFSYNIYDCKEGEVVQVATTSYRKTNSIVSMRNFPINALDEYHYYVYENGEIRSSYLSESDGLCKSAVNSMYAYSDKYGCAEIMLQTAPAYISEKLELDAWNHLLEKEIYAILIQDSVVSYNESDLILSNLYESYSTKFMN